MGVWLVGVGMLIAFSGRYSYQIRKREIRPRLSTWIIFLLGTALSLTTYAIAEKYDFRSGILNTLDTVSVATICLAILVWGKCEIRFKTFEKYYLAGIGAIVVYGFATGNAWSSNIFAQVLIGLGYVPTIQNLIVEKRNTESFTAWGVGMLAGFMGLYPALVGSNSLAILYSLRTIGCTATILTIMAYYEFCSQRSRS